MDRTNEQQHLSIHTRSVSGRKSLWLFAFRTTSLLVGGGILPTLSEFMSIHSLNCALCTFIKAWPFTRNRNPLQSGGDSPATN